MVIDRIVEAYRAGAFNLHPGKALSRRWVLRNLRWTNCRLFCCGLGGLLKLPRNFFFHPDSVERARQLLEEALERTDAITVGEARVVWQTSRKYAVPLLELFDNLRVTRRVGDKRVLVKTKN